MSGAAHINAMSRDQKITLTRVILEFFRSPSVRALDKIIVLVWPAYVALPFDLLPEAVLGPLGLSDDIAVVLRAVYLGGVIIARYRKVRRT